MTLDTLDVSISTPGIERLVDFLCGLDEVRNGQFAASVRDTVLDALKFGKPSGTMRSWLMAHTGQTVTTVQVTNSTGQVWAPTSRVVMPFATFVELSGSRRYFAGMRVVVSTDRVLVVADDQHTIAYFADQED